MRPYRIFTRLILLLAFVGAVISISAVLVLRGLESQEAWAVVAAALAVITSVFASLGSHRVIELQEDAQKPNPYPTFDFESRYGLALLKIKNTGSTAARDIDLEWEPALINHNGKVIGFQKEAGSNYSPLVALRCRGQWDVGLLR